MALNVGTLVAELRLDDSQFNRATDQGEKRFSKLGSFLGTAAKTVGAAGAGAIAAAGAVGIKTAAGMEQASIGFTTMLGSGKKAQAFLTQLNAFAAATPFDLPGLQTAASSLISAGIDAKNVIPIMTSLGNATSGMGTGAEGVQRATVALQQMNAAGKISGEDLNQLRDAGIPVYDLLATATGKSKAQVVALAQAGKLGKTELSQLMAALADGKGLERFNGLMQKQSQSLSGLWSTAKDTFSVGMAQAIQPLIPLLKEGLGGATTLLARALPHVTAAVQLLADSWADFQEGLRGNADGVKVTDFLSSMAWAGDRARKSFEGLKAGGATAVAAVRDLMAGWTKAGDGVAYFSNSTQTYGAQAHLWIWKIKTALHDVFPAKAGGGVDWAATLERVKTTAAQLWPYLVSIAQSMRGLHPVMTVAGAVFGFLADHIDTLVTLMPLLVAAFVAYKAAQTVSMVADILHLPVTIALAASNFAYASAVWALLAAMGVERTSRIASLILWIRSTAVTVAHTAAIWAMTAASWALTAVSKAITAAQWLWNAAITANPIGIVIVLVAAFVGGLIMLYKHSDRARAIMDAVWAAVKTGVGAMWAVVQPIFKLWVGEFKVVGAAAVFMWDRVVRPVLAMFMTGFTKFAGGVLGVASKIARAVGMDGLADKLDNAKREVAGFGESFNKTLAGLHDKNVTVTAVGTFSDNTGAKKDRTHKGWGQALADGGLVRGPGGPRDDLIYNAVSNGEFVVNARDTARARPVLEAINAGHYADGGLVVDVKSNTRSLTRGLPAWYDQVVGSVRSSAQASADRAARASFAFGQGTSIGAGVQRWSGLVLQVLGELGLSPGLLPRVLRQIRTESGGNPNATQGNIGDVNNRTGDLARGLMQVIGGTFRAFAGPYAGLGQYNPHASVYAGLNYARHRYGSDLSYLGQGHGYANGGLVIGGRRIKSAGVYDTGGILPPNGLALNLGRGGERILNPAESATYDRRRSGEAPDVIVHARVFVGDREITDIVRTEVDVKHAELATALTYGA